ncbi:hypothetical protein [Campylobacter fetus]|nr:hypothetical protein IXZ22_06435 [Campylobacter fetus subsp. venerealis]
MSFWSIKMDYELGNIRPKLDRHKLGLGLVKTGLKESLHKFIKKCDM